MTSPASDSAYPEQRHAGQVGYGPNFHAGPTLEEKARGLKDELKGKIKNDSDLVKQGRDLRTGEAKRKKMRGEDEPDLFQTAAEGAKEQDTKDANVAEEGKGR